MLYWKDIAIAAVSGGGRTTIIYGLKDHLLEATVINFDDYDFKEFPADICDWAESELTMFAYRYTEMSNLMDLTIFAYLEMLTSTKPDSDYIVDGSLPIHSIVNIILDELKGVNNES